MSYTMVWINATVKLEAECYALSPLSILYGMRIRTVYSTYHARVLAYRSIPQQCLLMIPDSITPSE